MSMNRYRARSNPVTFESKWPRWVHYLIAFAPLGAFGLMCWRSQW